MLPAGGLATVSIGDGPDGNIEDGFKFSIAELQYSSPASNIFVGMTQSLQGMVGLCMVFPVGWFNDRRNRYRLLMLWFSFGIVAACVLIPGVLLFSKTLVMIGVVLFAMYQQSLTGTIYTILSDNVPRGDRSKAGFNYKSISAFA